MSEQKNKKMGLGKFLAGAGIGVTLGLLFAPKSGEETRKELKVKMDDLVKKAKNVKMDEVKDAIETKVAEIKEDLKNLDKEQVAEKIKDGAKEIKRKADELVDIAVKKGTPVIEAAAREVKESTIKTLENITSKLKDEEKPDNKKDLPKKQSPKASK